MRRPATVYIASRTTYLRPLVTRMFEPLNDVARVDKYSFIKWNRRNMLVSSALKHEYVDPEVDGLWDVSWGAIALGWLDAHRPERGLIYSRRRRGASEVSAMSFVEP